MERIYLLIIIALFLIMAIVGVSILFPSISSFTSYMGRFFGSLPEGVS